MYAYAHARFFVFELIIQVSDQPVAPSGGLMTSTWTAGSSPWSRFVMICQVVPTVDVAGAEVVHLLGVVRPSTG